MKLRSPNIPRVYMVYIIALGKKVALCQLVICAISWSCISRDLIYRGRMLDPIFAHFCITSVFCISGISQTCTNHKHQRVRVDSK